MGGRRGGREGGRSEGVREEKPKRGKERQPRFHALIKVDTQHTSSPPSATPSPS